MNDLSIVIPSQNDSIELKILLKAINNFKIKPKEIIVIDSSNDDKITNLVNNFEIKDINLIYEKIPKSYAGKSINYSIKYIKSKYTGFLDTKTIPYSSWIRDYLPLLKNKNYDLIFGSTYYKSETFLQNCLKTLGYGNKSHETVPGTIIKTEIFKKFCQFAENIRAGYDIEWRNRVKKNFKYYRPKKSYIFYNSLPKKISNLIFKYIIYSFHTAKADILNNVKGAYLSIFLIIVALLIPIWNDIVWGWNDNLLYIPYITTTYLFLISIYLISTLILSNIFPNFFKTNIIFNTAFYIFLFLFIFSIINLDNNIIQKFIGNFTYIETSYSLFSLFIFYIFYRNVYKPLRNDVNFFKLFPFNFLKLIPISLIIDLAKGPGYILGSLIYFVRILTFDRNYLLKIPQNNKKIIFFSKYGNKSASIRCRIDAYKDILEENGYIVENNTLFNDKFFSSKIFYNKINFSYLFFAYLKRIIFLITAPKPFVAVIHIELLPFLSVLGEIILKIRKIDYVIDIDDAVYHRFQKSKFKFLNSVTLFKFKKIVSMSKCTFAGNQYHIDFFSSQNTSNYYFPTVIDTNKYNKYMSKNKYSNFTVVWIGTPSTSVYLKEIEKELQILNTEHNINFVFIGFGNIKLNNINYKKISWNEETEIQEISKCHVGIMPLSIDKWVLGKCAYKILQYMACELPVVATSVGVNKIIIKNDHNGLLVNKNKDWVNKILKLKNDSKLYNKIAFNGFNTVKKDFDIKEWKIKYLKTINMIFNG